MNSKKTYSVLIIDNFHMDPEHDYVIEGFSTKKIAIEFARRWVRSSVEHQRKSNVDREELKLLWYQFGEDATVLGNDYAGGDELDFFLDNPATPEECDWQSIKQVSKK